MRSSLDRRTREPAPSVNYHLDRDNTPVYLFPPSFLVQPRATNVPARCPSLDNTCVETSSGIICGRTVVKRGFRDYFISVPFRSIYRTLKNSFRGEVNKAERRILEDIIPYTGLYVNIRRSKRLHE